MPQPMNQPGQMPDHRLQEIQQQFREMQEQNRQLRAHIDMLTARQMQQSQPQGQPPVVEDSPFEAPVQKALDKQIQDRFQKLLQPIAQQYEQKIGYVSDQNDHLRFLVKFGNDAYEKYKDKIENLRQDYARQGRFLSREEAYKFTFFEENGSKPKEQNQPAQPAAQIPYFDPYLGKMVHPEQTQAPAPQPGQQQMQPGQPPQQVPGQPAPAYQQQPQQQMAPGYPSHPQAAYAQPQGQWQPNQWIPQPQQQQMPQMADEFGLPPATTPPMTPAPKSSPQAGFNLNLDSSEDDLAAFEQRYGNVPLP